MTKYKDQDVQFLLDLAFNAKKQGEPYAFYKRLECIAGKLNRLSNIVELLNEKESVALKEKYERSLKVS